MNIKISCIIPYYNVEKDYLMECINSILHQDFQDYEIIIVNDGSDEEYVTYLEEICLMDNRINIIHRCNGGVSSARNIGMKYAQGKYITFVDADDIVSPVFFSEAYSIASENDADYVVGKVIKTSSRRWEINLNQEVSFEIKPSDHYRLTLISLKNKTHGTAYFGRGPWARIIKRDILKNIFFPENVKLGEDEIWNLDVISKCENIYMVNSIWYLYWDNPDSASNKFYEDIIYICEQHLNEMLKRIDLKKEEEIIAYFCHVYEFLYRHIYKCYLGRKECTLSFIKKNQMFCDLCKKEPWLLNQFKSAIKHGNKKTRLNYMLFRSGFLFWFWSFRERIKSDN